MSDRTQESDQVKASASVNGEAAAPNPFDVASLRLTTDYQGGAAKKVLLTVPVRKPHNSWFIRVHPDPAFRLETKVIEAGDGIQKEVYLVAKELWSELEGEPAFSSRVFYVGITKQGKLFIWPVNLPKDDGKDNSWNRSARDAATFTMTKWARVISDTTLGGYQLLEPPIVYPDPVWPDMTFDQILNLAFKNNRIADIDHIVLKNLRGE
jgi:hypothetical protein